MVSRRQLVGNRDVDARRCSGGVSGRRLIGSLLFMIWPFFLHSTENGNAGLVGASSPWPSIS